MSYAFDMSFAMAADEKEAFVLARHYVEKCMEKKNARKFIEDNTIYIPSIRYSHVEKANNMAEVAVLARNSFQIPFSVLAEISAIRSCGIQSHR